MGLFFCFYLMITASFFSSKFILTPSHLRSCPDGSQLVVWCGNIPGIRDKDHMSSYWRENNKNGERNAVDPWFLGCFMRFLCMQQYWNLCTIILVSSLLLRCASYWVICIYIYIYINIYIYIYKYIYIYNLYKLRYVDKVHITGDAISLLSEIQPQVPNYWHH